LKLIVRIRRGLARQFPFTCSDAERRLKPPARIGVVPHDPLSHAVMPKGV